MAMIYRILLTCFFLTANIALCAENYLIVGEKQELAVIDSTAAILRIDTSSSKYSVDDAELLRGNTLFYSAVATPGLVKVEIDRSLSNRAQILANSSMFFLFKMKSNDALAGNLNYLSGTDVKQVFCRVNMDGTTEVLRRSDDLIYPRSNLKRSLFPDDATTFSTGELLKKDRMKTALSDIASQEDNWEIVGQSIQYKLFARKKPRSWKEGQPFAYAYALYDRLKNGWLRVDVPEEPEAYVFNGIVVFKGFKPPIVRVGYKIYNNSGNFYFLKYPDTHLNKIRIPDRKGEFIVHYADQNHILLSSGVSILTVNIRDPKNPVIHDIGKSPFPISKLFELTDQTQTGDTKP